MKFFKKNLSMLQSDSNKSRKFTLGQYIAAVTTLLLSVTAISYAAGLLTLIQFQPNTVILSADVNTNFQRINDQLAAMTAAISNVQVTAASDATTKANAAQSAAITQAGSLYQPKFGTSGWVDYTGFKIAGNIYQNGGNAPIFVLIQHGNGSVNFVSSSTLNFSTSVNTGGDQSSGNNTATVSGSYVVPPNYYYRIDGAINMWFEYTM